MAAKPTRRIAAASAAEQIKSHRVVARVTAGQKDLLERAAALKGRSLSDFLLASAQDAAHRAIREQEAMVLSARDTKAFVAGLLHPRPINKRLRETVRRYQALSPAKGG